MSIQHILSWYGWLVLCLVFLTCEKSVARRSVNLWHCLGARLSSPTSSPLICSLSCTHHSPAVPGLQSHRVLVPLVRGGGHSQPGPAPPPVQAAARPGKEGRDGGKSWQWPHKLLRPARKWGNLDSVKFGLTYFCTGVAHLNFSWSLWFWITFWICLIFLKSERHSARNENKQSIIMINPTCRAGLCGAHLLADAADVLAGQ